MKMLAGLAIAIAAAFSVVGGGVLATAPQHHYIPAHPPTRTPIHVIRHVPAPGGLRPGKQGTQVVQLNQRLYALHYLITNQGAHYGQATTDAVIAFQKWEGLPRDGVAGPQTLARLKTATAPTPLLAGAGKRVEVSLSKQVAEEVDSGQVLWTLHVSTGKPGFETPVGRYQVYTKSTRSWSSEYSEWLPYASFFHNGYGIHGLAEVPVTPGSHGCVRVPMENAPLIYQFATIGTEVDILP